MKKRTGKNHKSLSARYGVLLALLFAALFFAPVSAYAGDCADGGDHDFEVELVKQSTNSEEGLRIYTCTKCGYSYEEVIENFGHEWTEWTVVTEPGCETTGIEERHCTKCDGSEQRRIDSLGHEWGDWVEQGDKEVRTCLRNPEHTQEREVVIVTETETVTTDTPAEVTPAAPVAEPTPEPEPEAQPEVEVIEETVVEEVIVEEPEAEPEPEPLLVAAESEDVPPAPLAEEVSEEKQSWIHEWTPANTAVATGGGFVLIAFGALLFTGYISPWLWVLAKRRKKREEAAGRMDV